MIDAHVHVWQIARGDYDWLAGEDVALRRDFTLEDWATAAAPTPVTAAVLVQATPTAAESTFVRSVAAANPDRVVGVVGWAALEDADAPARVAELAEDPVVVGVRPWLQAIEDPSWILRADVARGLAAVEEAGLVYEALALPVHLSRLVELVERRPGLRVVLDHAAKPDIAHGALDAWAADLGRLAAAGPVVCKLSGLLTEAGSRTSEADLRPYVETVLTAFGPDRVMWGSDWPVVSTVASYADWHTMARALVPAADHDAVFADTARRAYGLESSVDGARP